MNYKYSKKTGGFYLGDTVYKDIPDDTVDVSQAEYDQAQKHRYGNNLIDVVNGKIFLMPVAPSPYCDWNSSTKKWVENIEKKAAANARILDEVFPMAVQEHLDAFAKTRGYDNINSAASYVNSANLKFKTEALYAVQVRDSFYDLCFMKILKIKAGSQDMPESSERFIDDFPALKWPNE